MKPLALAILALLLVPSAVSAFACSDEVQKQNTVFGLSARDRQTDDDACLDNGLRPGSYFDSKGRIVGSPCDPEEYCADRGSTDVAVIDYCSDTWNELDDDRDDSDNNNANEQNWEKFCADNPNVIPCNHNDIPTPPQPEPPVEDCSHEGVGVDVCRPVDIDDSTDEDENEEQEEEEESIPEESHHNTDVHDVPE